MKRKQELNILCIGELTAGKSTFLQLYTSSDHSKQHYKIFARSQQIGSKSAIIYLHEIEQKNGAQVYLSSQYDGVLFFVRIDGFHNTSRNIVDSLSLYSQLSGTNIYHIPIKIVVISSKAGSSYDDIAYSQKSKLKRQVECIVDESQIIYVQSNQKYYEGQLCEFYLSLLEGQGTGIKDNIYSSWQTRNIYSFIFPTQLKLTMSKMYQQLKSNIWQKMISYRLIRKKNKQ